MRVARPIAKAVGLAALGLAAPVSPNPHKQHAAAIDEVPLYDNLGDHHYAITTDVPAAQAYFDQGLRLYYAFNHAEGVRAFRKAQALEFGAFVGEQGIDPLVERRAMVAERETIDRLITTRSKDIAWVSASITRCEWTSPPMRSRFFCMRSG